MFNIFAGYRNGKQCHGLHCLVLLSHYNHIVQLTYTYITDSYFDIINKNTIVFAAPNYISLLLKVKMAMLTNFLRIAKQSRLNYKHLTNYYARTTIRCNSYYPINDVVFGFNEDQQQVIYLTWVYYWVGHLMIWIINLKL